MRHGLLISLHDRPIESTFRPGHARATRVRGVCRCCCWRAATAWPQSAPPPTLGVQPPAQQSAAGTARAAGKPSIRRAARARKNPGPDQRARQALGQIDLRTHAEDRRARPQRSRRSRARGDSLTSIAKPSIMVTGARGLRGRRQRCARLQGRRRPAVPEQGLQGRQEPRHRLPPKNALRKVYIPGRKREPGDCRIETFVTRAPASSVRTPRARRDMMPIMHGWADALAYRENGPIWQIASWYGVWHRAATFSPAGPSDRPDAGDTKHPEGFLEMPIPALFKNRLSIPVIGSPMFIVSGPDLVIAQCKAGVVGSFPALNARPQRCSTNGSRGSRKSSPSMTGAPGPAVGAVRGQPDRASLQQPPRSRILPCARSTRCR